MPFYHLLSLSGFYSFSQADKVYAKIEITSFLFDDQQSYTEPSADTSTEIIVEKFACTDIIKLGWIDTTEVGFQLELLKSHLGGKEIILSGVALFTRKNGKWEMHSNPICQLSNYKTIPDKSLISEKEVTNTSLTIQGLRIDYKQLYYIIK